MKSTIVTIFPTPSERYVTARSALTVGSSPPAREGPKLINSAVEALPSIESIILQKLLAEVEARQITRAQPTYDIEPSLPPDRVILRRMLWGTSWVLSIAITALAVNHIDSRTLVASTGDHESRSIEALTANLIRQSESFSGVSNSLQQLSAVIESAVNRSVMIREISQPHPDQSQQEQAAVVSQGPPAVPDSTLPVIIGNSAPKTDSSPIPMGGHIHPRIEWAVPPANAIVHHDSMGVMDYWLLPRMQGGTAVMEKVVPVLQNNSGIFVHDVAEAKDYLVTPSGNWVEATDTRDKP